MAAAQFGSVNDMGNPPTVSTIITSYNKGPYLSEAIHSALQQEYEPHEILVIDDGSTDDTRQVVESFGDQVRYVYQPNGGQSSAENHGIRLARGNLIAFLDGDDRWRDGKLRKQVEVFQNRPDTALVYTRSWVFDHTTGATPGVWQRPWPMYRGCVLDQLLIWNFVPFSSAMVRRDCLLDVGMFDETVAFPNDLDLWLRIARKYPFDYVDEELLEYRVGIGQVTSTTSDAYMKAIAVQQRFVDRFYNGHYPRPNVVRKGIAARYAAHGDMLLAGARHLGAFLAHSRALCYDPTSLRAYLAVLRDLVPNWLVDRLRSAFKAQAVSRQTDICHRPEGG